MFFSYIGTLLFSFNLVYGYNADTYTISTTNTCVDSCEANSLSLIQCSCMCIQVQGCQGVTLNTNDGNCCVCSSIGVPTQSVDPGNVFYRTTNDPICQRNLVNDVPNSHLTASRSFQHPTVDHGPARGRLHTLQQPTGTGGWCTGTRSQNDFIQVRFYSIKEVFDIATQGRHSSYDNQWVSSYKVSYSVDCVTFDFVTDSDNQPKIFPGNYDKNSVVRNRLPETILAVCVRVHPFTMQYNVAMRFGVMGCDINV